MILGIDLGTTHTLAARLGGQQPQLMTNAHGSVLTPSVVSVDADGTILVGESARHRLITHPEHTASEFKRFMGTDKQFCLGDQCLDASELSALVLKSVKHDAERHLGQPAEQAIVSVPAYFNNKQREATKHAARLAGFQSVSLINEPTAAALAFGVDGHQDDEAHYIVLDLGGGTFDVTLLEVFNGIFEVHASAGDNYLGGRDFTDCIARHLAEQHQIDIETLDGKAPSRLYDGAETLKCRLTGEHEISETLNIGAATLSYCLDLPTFTRICAPLLERIKQPIKRVLGDAGLSASSLNGIILVGGATRMQPFRALVSRLFQRIPRSDYHPDEAIARGCAIQAGLMEDNESVSDVVMTDVCPYTLGVAVAGTGMGEEFLPLIERNSAIPVSETRPLWPMHPAQTCASIRVYQGEAFKPEHNLYLGSLNVEFPDDPDKRPLLLTYTYDLDGTLEIEVRFPGTADRYQAYIKDGNLTEDQSLAERFERLSALKILPADQQQNREMRSRLERRFEESIGDEREQIGILLHTFNDALSTHNERKIAATHDLIKEHLSQHSRR